MIGESRNVSNWIAVYPFVYILPQRRVRGEEMVDKSSIWYVPKPFIRDLPSLLCFFILPYFISLPSPLSLCLVSGFFSPANEKGSFIFFLSFFVFPMRKSLEVKKGKRISARKRIPEKNKACRHRRNEW